MGRYTPDWWDDRAVEDGLDYDDRPTLAELEAEDDPAVQAAATLSPSALLDAAEHGKALAYDYDEEPF